MEVVSLNALVLVLVIKTKVMLCPVPKLTEKKNNFFPLVLATSLFAKQAKSLR